jgi:hypothetical protein
MLIYLIGCALALVVLTVEVKIIKDEFLLRDMIGVILLSFFSYVVLVIGLWALIITIASCSTLFNKKLF